MESFNAWCNIHLQTSLTHPSCLTVGIMLLQKVQKYTKVSKLYNTIILCLHFCDIWPWPASRVWCAFPPDVLFTCSFKPHIPTQCMMNMNMDGIFSFWHTWFVYMLLSILRACCLVCRSKQCLFQTWLWRCGHLLLWSTVFCHFKVRGCKRCTHIPSYYTATTLQHLKNNRKRLLTTMKMRHFKNMVIKRYSTSLSHIPFVSPELAHSICHVQYCTTVIQTDTCCSAQGNSTCFKSQNKKPGLTH